MGKDPLKLLLGQLAIDAGLLTRPQLQEALKLQARGENHRPLGEILVALAYLSPSDLATLLARQQEMLGAGIPRPLRDQLLGHLLIREKIIPAPLVHQALREQAQMAEEGIKVPLGQLLLERKSLTGEQIKRSLDLQAKSLVHCPACKLYFNAGTAALAQLARLKCPFCFGMISRADRITYDIAVVGEITPPAPLRKKKGAGPTS